METTLKALKSTGVAQSSPPTAAANAAGAGAAAAKSETGMDSKQLKAFQEQIRGILRTELQNMFRTSEFSGVFRRYFAYKPL